MDLGLSRSERPVTRGDEESVRRGGGSIEHRGADKTTRMRSDRHRRPFTIRMSVHATQHDEHALVRHVGDSPEVTFHLRPVGQPRVTEGEVCARAPIDRVEAAEHCHVASSANNDFIVAMSPSAKA